MGAGGDMSSADEKPRGGHDPLHRVPTAKPPFTLGDIKKAVPPHCFRRSALRSFSYLAQDLAVAAGLLYLATSFLPLLPSPLHLLAWPLYWAAQGCVLGGVWFLGHECGHNAFSDFSLLDDAVGLLLHSALLVPYFSWKYSHRRHHANIGNLERDEVYVPQPKAGLPWFSKYLNNPPGRCLRLLPTLTLGWPLYLVFNTWGRHYDSFACHYDPYAPIYSDRERAQIFVSDAGVLGMAYVLLRLVGKYSLASVVRLYGVPLLVVNRFVVLITYL